MFGSSYPFGQSSNSPFGSQSVFGQANNASSNPFAPKPFGSTTPFGSQTGGSIFSGTSSGIFGATQSSSPLTSTPAFGASSAPAFGGSMSAFGASSTPAFGASSSQSFGSSSIFGQKFAFGGFGSSTTQTSPFGSTFQQLQPAFGSSLFGSSTPFGAPSQPTSGVLCDKRIPTRLKGKFYRTAIRLAILYGTKCWATKKHVDKMSVVEMRILRWMCGKIRQDRIRNECIREWVGVAPIEDKLRENRLRWFGHIQWRPMETVVKRCDAVTVDGSVRGRGKLRLTLASVLNTDMDLLNLTNEMAFDRTAWRRRIHVTDPI